MRPVAKILTALGFAWTCAVSAFLLAGSRGRVRTTFTLAEGAGEPVPASVALMSSDGVWLTTLFLLVTVCAGVPLGVAIFHPSGHALTTWTVGLLLCAFCLLTAFGFGPFFLPGALALLASAHLSQGGGEVLVARR